MKYAWQISKWKSHGKSRYEIRMANLEMKSAWQIWRADLEGKSGRRDHWGDPDGSPAVNLANGSWWTLGSYCGGLWWSATYVTICVFITQVWGNTETCTVEKSCCEPAKWQMMNIRELLWSPLKKCHIQGAPKMLICRLNLFQRSNFIFSHVFRDQNFEPSSTKQFEHANPESIIDLQLQKGLRARRENPSLENPMHFSLKFGLGENYARACVFGVFRALNILNGYVQSV